LLRIIVETLKQTKTGAYVNILSIAELARTTPKLARAALERLANIEDLSVQQLDSAARFKLALEGLRLGGFQQIARTLTWQEFEEFAEDCLRNSGFETQRGVSFNDGKRRWQVDLTASRGQAMLVLDCKHWESPNYPSKFSTAIEHHKQSLKPLIRHMKASGLLTLRQFWALPIILTLFEPRSSVIGGVVIVSIGQLPDLLEHLTPYDPALPFVAENQIVENPIS
jgi:hypothetical protein